MHETLFVFIIIIFIDFFSVSIVTFGRFGAFCLQGKVVCCIYLCNIQTTSDSTFIVWNLSLYLSSEYKTSTVLSVVCCLSTVKLIYAQPGLLPNSLVIGFDCRLSLVIYIVLSSGCGKSFFGNSLFCMFTDPKPCFAMVEA